MNKSKVNKLVKISVLTSIAFVLMLLDFPMPPFPAFLKIDLSDLPALFGAFALGPSAGIIIELVKNILHVIIKPDTLGIGELANFTVGAAFVFTAGLIYRIKKNKSHALYGMIAGTVFMGLIAALGNYFVFLPLYQKFLGWPMPPNLASFLVVTIVPFNMVKGVMVSIIAFFSYKSLSPILHKQLF